MNKRKLSLGRYDYAAYSAYAMYSVASLVIPLMIVAIGRDLDFRVQEMNRETNTIGSKANQLAITEEVLSLKNEIEKIREQAQNVE